MKFGTQLGNVFLVPAAREVTEGETVICAADTVAYAKVSCLRDPLSLQLKLRVEADWACSRCYLLRSGKPPQEIKATNEEHFLLVGVKWDGDIPKTRDTENNSDCLDVFIIEPNGRFVDFECGLITRGGKFFMSAQRVYEGQATRTRKDGKVVTELLPARAIHAYPGSNFQNVWTTLADVALEKVAETKASLQKSRSLFRPRWNPPTLPQANGGGWIPGVVRYFNAMTGTGELQDAAGKKCFVHFRSILGYTDRDPRPEVPLLTPMSVVLFRLEPTSQRERPKIKSVRPLRPVLSKEPTR